MKGGYKQNGRGAAVVYSGLQRASGGTGPRAKRKMGGPSNHIQSIVSHARYGTESLLLLLLAIIIALSILIVNRTWPTNNGLPEPEGRSRQ
jgi:hypothetical protein